jgi:hypothetical protein
MTRKIGLKQRMNDAMKKDVLIVFKTEAVCMSNTCCF